MKKFKLYAIGAASSLLAFASCSNFLDPLPYGNFPEEDLWLYPSIVEGFVGKGYSYLKKSYNDTEGFYLDGATDDAVVTSTSNSMARLGLGTMTTSSDPFAAFYTNDYQAIGSVNRFLEDSKGFNTRYKVDLRQDSLTRYMLQGEAFALRAWYQLDLLKRYGGMGIDGNLLGFPIVTEAFNDVMNDEIARPRNTYDECVKQIQLDCDSAYKYLPIAHRDYLMEESTDKGVTGSINWGRFDGITTRAMLAQMYLTYASPLFNPSNDLSRWETAAKYAKEVMDFKLNVDNVDGGFDPKEGVSWTNPNFAGIVFSSGHNSNQSATEVALYPSGFRGSGVIGATQELVDAFPMANGYPKDHPEGDKLYDPQNPYAYRDPRFYSVIFYNGATADRLNNTSSPMYTFDSWVGEDGTIGKDMAGNTSTSRTNYHIKKFIHMGWNKNDTNVSTMPRSKFYIRWAHMVLAFAEAVNEVEGPNGTKFGLSAKEAMQYLRQRDTYDGEELYVDEDPYLDEVANQGQAAFREFIHNERRIETCFEGMRFYDIRRWSTAGDLSLINTTITRPSIVKKADGTFEYNTPVEVEKRTFTTPYMPLPYTEVLRVDQLVQNAGWGASWE